MTFTHQPYSGDKNGELRILVFDENKNFIRDIGSASTTQEYVGAGGQTFATLAELSPFKANLAFLKYPQTSIQTSTVKTTTSGLFANSGSVLSGTGNGSGDYKAVPDPRISHRITLNAGSTNSISLLGPTGPTHMTQLVITDTSSSKTFDCYFGRYFDGFTTGTTVDMEIMLVGVTGAITGGFAGRTGPFLIEAPGGQSGEFTKDNTVTLKNLNSFKQFISDQVGASLNGSTFDGITYGTSRTGHAVFFRGTTDLNELATISSLVQANLKGETGDRITSIHLPLVGTTVSAISGITFNSQTGGCAAASEFDDAVGQLFKARLTAQTNVGKQLRAMEDATTIRALVSDADLAF